MQPYACDPHFLYGCEEICFWAARVGKQKRRNPLQDGTLLGGIGQVLSLRQTVLGRFTFWTWGSLRKWMFWMFFPYPIYLEGCFSLEKGYINGLAGENTVNQMWFQQTNRPTRRLLAPQRPTFLRSGRGFTPTGACDQSAEHRKITGNVSGPGWTSYCLQLQGLKLKR